MNKNTIKENQKVSAHQTNPRMNRELWQYVLCLQSANELTPSQSRHLQFWTQQLGKEVEENWQSAEPAAPQPAKAAQGTSAFMSAPKEYPDHLRCTNCETLVHKSRLSKHSCWDAKRIQLSENCPKSSTLRLR